MFNSIKKDKNRRNLVKKFEIQRLQNKVLSEAIAFIEDTSSKVRDEKESDARRTNIASLKNSWQKKAFKTTPRNSSKNRVQNRCIETGRSRAVLRFCKLSRIILRDKASKGLVSGVSKASW